MSTLAAGGGVAAERVLVMDFGSQYAQLIARRVRENNVYCEIVRHDISAEQLQKHKPRGLILSGGPKSVYESGAPRCDPRPGLLPHSCLPPRPGRRTASPNTHQVKDYGKLHRVTAAATRAAAGLRASARHREG